MSHCSGPTELMASLLTHFPETRVTHGQLKKFCEKQKFMETQGLDDMSLLFRELSCGEPIITEEFVVFGTMNCRKASSSEWSFAWEVDSDNRLNRICFYHKKGICIFC